MIRNAEAGISAINDDIDANSNTNTNALTGSMEEIDLIGFCFGFLWQRQQYNQQERRLSLL